MRRNALYPPARIEESQPPRPLQRQKGPRREAAKEHPHGMDKAARHAR